MIADLKPYFEYKESGLPWLGDIPNHWSSERAKWLFTKMDRPVREEDEVVTCFRDGMVTLRKNRRLRGFTEATAFFGYQGIRKGDLVIHGMDAFAGAIGVSDSDGKGTPVYNVCQPRPGANASYYAQLVRQMSQSQWILALAKGIRERSTDFRFEMFGNQRVPLPPIAEQEAIVRFLDWANGRIDRTIRSKKRVIALLNEQKRAIIERAVTLGANHTVPTKPSVVPWVKEIPAHWETRPLKQLLSRMDYGTSENVRAEGPIRVLTMTHIRDGRVVLPMKGGLANIPPGLLLENHDLLFNRTNSPELVGKVGIFAGEARDQVTFASYLVRLRVRKEHNPIWLNYLLNSSRFWSFARSQALVSLHQANLNPNRYGRMLLPIPPSRAEQDEIVVHISGKAEEIERTESRLQREVELLQEYRIRLIADVVTGKLDVRQAAAALPIEELTADSVVGEDPVEPDEDSEEFAEEGLAS